MGACLSFPILRTSATYTRVHNDEDDDADELVFMLPPTRPPPPGAAHEGLRERFKHGVFP